MNNQQEQTKTNEEKTKNRNKNINTLLWDVLEQIEQKSLNPSSVFGIPTGYIELDKILNGLHEGELIVLAARPAMGKSAFALNVAYNAALSRKGNVIIYSLELPGIQLSNRLFGIVGNIDSQAIQKGIIHESDLEKLPIAINDLSDIPLEIIDDVFTLKQIQSETRKLKQELGDIGLIVVDYLQLINVEGNFRTQYERVSHISRSLKLLARELDVPIIAVSELSRAVEQRQDKRPILSDLRDSGCLEEDADVVIFLHRDDYYNVDSVKKNIADVIVGKHRNGPEGEVKLLFLKKYLKFLNLEIRK